MLFSLVKLLKLTPSFFLTLLNSFTLYVSSLLYVPLEDIFYLRLYLLDLSSWFIVEVYFSLIFKSLSESLLELLKLSYVYWVVLFLAKVLRWPPPPNILYEWEADYYLGRFYYIGDLDLDDMRD